MALGTLGGLAVLVGSELLVTGGVQVETERPGVRVVSSGFPAERQEGRHDGPQF